MPCVTRPATRFCTLVWLDVPNETVRHNDAEGNVKGGGEEDEEDVEEDGSENVEDGRVDDDGGLESVDGDGEENFEDGGENDD